MAFVVLHVNVKTNYHAAIKLELHNFQSLKLQLQVQWEVL